MKIVNKYIIACLCNDSDNSPKYRVDDNGDCWYNDELIGLVNETYNPKDNVIDIYYKPIAPVKYVNISFKILGKELSFWKKLIGAFNNKLISMYSLIFHPICIINSNHSPNETK